MAPSSATCRAASTPSGLSARTCAGQVAGVIHHIGGAEAADKPDFRPCFAVAITRRGQLHREHAHATSRARDQHGRVLDRADRGQAVDSGRTATVPGTGLVQGACKRVTGSPEQVEAKSPPSVFVSFELGDAGWRGGT